MKIYHILNGDCLVEQLRSAEIDGTYIVMHECLVEGPVNADSQEEFFRLRETYLQKYSDDNYREKSVKELQKIHSIPNDVAVYLWFEDDLFCQVNLWYVLSQLQHHAPEKVFRVFPEIPGGEDKWKGFGISTNELLVSAFNKALPFTQEELKFGNSLWNAYQKNDLTTLKQLRKSNTLCFRDLEIVISAHADRYTNPGRPERIIKEILNSGVKEFQVLFSEFSKREGVYGFGDVQVKRLFDKLQ